jgi:hypothetical protein
LQVSTLRFSIRAQISNTAVRRKSDVGQQSAALYAPCWE